LHFRIRVDPAHQDPLTRRINPGQNSAAIPRLLVLPASKTSLSYAIALPDRLTVQACLRLGSTLADFRFTPESGQNNRRLGMSESCHQMKSSSRSDTPFPNGNGRHARMFGNVYLEQHFGGRD
jgi:hypothetical protein